jgi:hypothetical protein
MSGDQASDMKATTVADPVEILVEAIKNRIVAEKFTSAN